MGKTLVSEYTITTPVFRLAFPAVDKASQIQGKGDFKFRITMLFENDKWNDELLPFRKLVKDLIEKKFGVGTQPPEGFNIAHLFKDGNLSVSKKSGEIYDGFENAKVINAASDYKRVVVDGGNKEKGIKPQEVLDVKNEIYAGCYYKAVVNAFLWDNVGGQGVSIGFLALQKVKDGKPFSVFADAAADFEPITTELLEGDKEKLFEPEVATGDVGETAKTNLLDQL